MDYEFNMSEVDPSTNSVMATVVAQLTDAEEKRWREMLAEAWDAGFNTARVVAWCDEHKVEYCDAENPYRSNAD